MAARRVLAVVLEDGFEERLRELIAERGDGDVEVRVVVPAEVGVLDWLATAEDDARAEASARALSTEWSLADTADVAGEAAESDPLQAIEDALRSFPADELVVLGGAGRNGGLEHALGRFGVPVTWVRPAGPLRSRSSWREAVREIRAGRSRATPFVAFVTANLALLAFGVFASLLALLAFWLAA